MVDYFKPVTVTFMIVVVLLPLTSHYLLIAVQAPGKSGAHFETV